MEKMIPADETAHLPSGVKRRGLPEKLLANNIGSCLTIPMHGTRSLNLARAVAIVLFEAVRQQT
jgi:tRNA (cytidine/uridine-2'-O-)-methyltransferase